jgi:hypothetical protein
VNKFDLAKELAERLVVDVEKAHNTLAKVQCERVCGYSDIKRTAQALSTASIITIKEEK